MKLSIIILTWNCIEPLKKTFEVLKNELREVESEIIVVDNGSTDGCEKEATIANSENFGVSIGKNQGIDMSKGEFVFILDGDIVPVPNSVKCLLEYMEEHSYIDALGFPTNKFTREWNKRCEWCEKLVNISIARISNLYYGMLRRRVFDKGLRLEVRGPFAGVGYGWEEKDFFMQMQERNIMQYIANINNLQDKYYHNINSSIKLMGQDEYISSSKKRATFYKEKWNVE